MFAADLFCTNFLQLLSVPLMATVMEEVFSKLPLLTLILTLSKLFPNEKLVALL